MTRDGSTGRQTVIFTDLDGTLLDARTYSFAEARPALEEVRRRGIPLVLCSSKTRAEIEVWRDRLGNRHPFIAENGGSLSVPRGYFAFSVGGEERGGFHVLTLGRPYAEVRGAFVRLREALRVPVRGFGDMTPQEVARLTGLPLEDAVLALRRDHGEPFVFAGEPDSRFLRAIEEAGLQWTRGRLYHLMGNHDKGMAVAMLKALYQRDRGALVTVGIGDGANDLPLLLAADRPVLVRRPDGSHEPIATVPGLYRTELAGPAGWNEAVLGVLRDA